MTSNSAKAAALDFGFNPAPKPEHKRRRSSSERAEFPVATRKQIIDFFRGVCAECRRQPGTQIHHIRFRSQQGRGVFTNGLLLCHECHTDLHRLNEIERKWQFWAEKKYGANYYKDEDDLRGTKSFNHNVTRRKNKKGPKKKQPKKKQPKKQWPKRKLTTARFESSRKA